MGKKTRSIGVNMTPSATELGKFIRARRLQLGLGQVQLSQRAGMKQNYYSLLEVGKIIHPTEGVISKLADALECAPSELRGHLPSKRQKSELSLFILARLDELGITKEEFAHRLRTGRTGAYRLLCCGRPRSINCRTLFSLAQALELEPADLSRFARFRVAPVSAFGKLVRARRLELNFSVRDLARKLEVSPQRVSQLELGQEPSLRISALLPRLANALGFEVAMLRASMLARRFEQMKANQTSLGGLMVARRLVLRLTQREVATRAGTSQCYISRLERGDRPSGHMLEKIARVLECEVPPGLIPRPHRRVVKVRPRCSSLGRFVTERRLTLGISQIELAKRAGVAPSTLAAIEIGGRRSVWWYTLVKLSEALECEIPKNLVAESDAFDRRSRVKGTPSVS